MNWDFRDDAHAYIFSAQRALASSTLRVDESCIAKALRLRRQQEQPVAHRGPFDSHACNFDSSFLGLYCCGRKILRGELVCTYYGRVLRTSEALRVADKSYLMRLGEQCYVDSREYPHCLARYINDCRNPAGYNATFVKYTSHPQYGPCALVIALRNIAVGEEVFANYGPRYWSSSSDAVRLTFGELHAFRGPIE